MPINSVTPPDITNITLWPEPVNAATNYRNQSTAQYTSLTNQINVELAKFGVTNDSSSGADQVAATAITNLTGSTVQALLESIRNNLKATTDGSSGADFIAATAITDLTGGTVQALLESLKTYSEGIVSNAANNASSSISNVSNALNTHKTSTDHDGRYYTETEMATNGSAAVHGGNINASTITENKVSNEYIRVTGYGDLAGSANTYTLALDPAISDYSAGMSVSVKVNADNTTASTININSKGAKAIKRPNGSDVQAGNLKQNSIVTLRYNGTNFILQGEGAIGDATASDLLAGKTATTGAGDITGDMPNNAGDVAAVSAHMGTGTNIHVVPALGYTDGSDDASTINLTTVDADLAAGNIKHGVGLLGVTGNYDTEASVPIAAGTVLLDKVGFVNGTKITGTMPNNTGDVAAVSSHSGGSGTIHVVPALGYTNGSTDASVITDADFVAGNIKDTVEIFGVTGTYAGGGGATPDSNGWIRPSDWPDISSPANNTIELLVADTGLSSIAFNVVVANGGTYSVDWGDTNNSNGVTSDTTAEHTYTVGTGTACSRGYTTFVITITASDTITRFYVHNHSIANSFTIHGYLDAEFGTSGLTTIANLFNDATAPTINCRSLEHCRFNAALSSCVSAASAFNACVSLASVHINSLNAVTDANSMFLSCSQLKTIDISTMTAVTDATSMFNSCQNLMIDMDISIMTALLNTTTMFSSCYSLRNIDVTGLTLVNTATGMFTNCYPLITVTGLSGFSSAAASLTAQNMFAACEQLTSVDLSAAKLIKYSGTGQTNFANKSTSLLFHASSTFSGSAPQLDISYCSYNATQLNTLFTSLPNVSATIVITGNPGAGTCDQSIATAKGWTVTN